MFFTGFLLIVVLISLCGFIFIFWTLIIYNKLKSARVYVDQSWSQVDVQLKRRSSLIPNLVESVRAYAAHESVVLETVTALRACAQAQTVSRRADLESALELSTYSLLMVAQQYPDLAAAKNFQRLSRELVRTEDRIAASRGIYNSNVSHFNTLLNTVPSGWVGGMLGLVPAEFFQFQKLVSA